MDIEGNERSWINSLDQERILKIPQMVIEFHPWVNKNNFHKLNETHTLVHFHANNFSFVYKNVEIDDVDFPAFFEATYIRNDLIKDKKKNTNPLPTEYDRDNLKNFPKIEINYEPLVTR
jgi:hypothetical protein